MMEMFSVITWTATSGYVTPFPNKESFHVNIKKLVYRISYVTREQTAAQDRTLRVLA